MPVAGVKLQAQRSPLAHVPQLQVPHALHSSQTSSGLTTGSFCLLQVCKDPSHSSWNVSAFWQVWTQQWHHASSPHVKQRPSQASSLHHASWPCPCTLQPGSHPSAPQSCTRHKERHAAPQGQAQPPTRGNVHTLSRQDTSTRPTSVAG